MFITLEKENPMATTLDEEIMKMKNEMIYFELLYKAQKEINHKSIFHFSFALT